MSRCLPGSSSSARPHAWPVDGRSRSWSEPTHRCEVLVEGMTRRHVAAFIADWLAELFGLELRHCQPERPTVADCMRLLAIVRRVVALARMCVSDERCTSGVVQRTGSAHCSAGQPASQRESQPQARPRAFHGAKPHRQPNSAWPCAGSSGAISCSPCLCPAPSSPLFATISARLAPVPASRRRPANGAPGTWRRRLSARFQAGDEGAANEPPRGVPLPCGSVAGHMSGVPHRRAAHSGMAALRLDC